MADLFHGLFVPFVGHVAFEDGLYFFSAHANKLKHDLLVLVFILFVEELLERPILFFEQFYFDLFGLSLFSLLIFQGLYVKGAE
jgi:hypothetical protein